MHSNSKKWRSVLALLFAADNVRRYVKEMNMNDDEHIKEVYTHYGLAMYHAQCLERSLCILLAAEASPDLTKIKKSDYEDILDSLFKKTLGSIIKRLKQKVTISDELEKDIEMALQKRNWLAHNYFWERAGHFMSFKGRNYMLQELKNMSSFFDNIDSNISNITDEWAQKQGVTQNQIEYPKIGVRSCFLQK